MKKIIFTTTILVLFVSCTVTKNTARHSALNAESLANNTSPQPSPKEREHFILSEDLGAVSHNDTGSSTAAPIDKKMLLERLRAELIPQTKDYNPYRYIREEHIISILELGVDEWKDCDLVKELINKFYAADQKEREEYPVDYIARIGSFQCQEAYDFLEYQIKTSPLEKDRCTAITTLAWKLHPDYLPCILEYAKKDSLSVQEKSALACAFMVWGVYTFNPEFKEKSVNILDEICYNSSLDYATDAGCIWAYIKVGGISAINFFNSRFEQQKGAKKVEDALFLAWLGEYEKTFPIFVEIMNKGGVGMDIIYAIKGLAIIGTEEALRLIGTQIQSTNEWIAREAQGVLETFDRERRKK